MDLSAPLPEIGFDRFLQLGWVVTALGVRAGTVPAGVLDAQLIAAGLGREARAKTLTKLNALVLRPRPSLAHFVERGIRSFGAPREAAVAFAWGSSIANYPYFGAVAEVIGRLTAIQGECSTGQVHRRMSESYGDREITRRATQAVIQTMVNWCTVTRSADGRRLVRSPKVDVSTRPQAVWILEACIRYYRRPLPLTEIRVSPVLHPFEMGGSVVRHLTTSFDLEVATDGSANQLVMLRGGAL